jgi:hypothetical protein
MTKIFLTFAVVISLSAATLVAGNDEGTPSGFGGPYQGDGVAMLANHAQHILV